MRSPLSFLRSDGDLFFWGALCAVLLVAAAKISPLDGYLRHAPSSPKVLTARLECTAGSCWVRPQGTVNLYRIPESQVTRAYLGDEVMTLGPGSQLVVNFEDDKSELRLQNTGVIRISKGEQSVSLDKPESGGGASADPAAQVATANALVFVGEIPIKIVSPAAGTPILGVQFPLQLHLAFIVERYRPDEIAKLLEWSLVDMTNESQPQRIGTIQTQHTEPPVGGASFYADFQVSKPGMYALLPMGMDLTAKNIQFRFEVKSAGELEGQIKSLLQGVTTDSDRQIEIRQ